MADSLGEYLQQAREARGLSLEDAAAKTRILPQFLKAVEDNNYAQLPDEVFAKGFVRSYARVLGLDETEVIRKFNESGGQFYAKRAEREQVKQQLEDEAHRKKVQRLIALGLGAVVLVGLLVFAGLEDEPPDSSSAPAPAAPGGTAPSDQPHLPEAAIVPPAGQDGTSGAQDAPRPPPGPEPAPAAPVEAPSQLSPPRAAEPRAETPAAAVSTPTAGKLALEIEAVERCWVQVQADGGPIQEAMLYPGERVQWAARERFVLTLGNAGGVRISLNGQPQGPYGPSGKVVKDIVLNR